MHTVFEILTLLKRRLGQTWYYEIAIPVLHRGEKSLISCVILVWNLYGYTGLEMTNRWWSSNHPTLSYRPSPLWRIISFVNLEGAQDALYQAKYSWNYQNSDGDPERVPLRAISPIEPPLSQGSGCGVIIALLEHHQAVSPVLEPFYLSCVHFQCSTS